MTRRALDRATGVIAALGRAAVPVTVSPAVVPVLLRLMPFAAPLAEIDWNVAPPKSVLLTLTAVPVVVATSFRRR